MMMGGLESDKQSDYPGKEWKRRATHLWLMGWSHDMEDEVGTDERTLDMQ